MTTKKYVQKFRKIWLDRDELREWLIENPNDDLNGKYGGFCVFCSTPLPSKLYDLQSHAASRKHAKNVAEKTCIEVQESYNFEDACRTAQNHKTKDSSLEEDDSKEDVFGKYISSELMLIKNQKIYEEVKWKIIKILRNALTQESVNEISEA